MSDLGWEMDEADLPLLGGRNWRTTRIGDKFYVVSRKYDREAHACKTILLHRHIMSARPGDFVDHADGNTLNNHRSNLRICTKRQNQQNSRKRRTYRGKPTQNRLKGAHPNGSGRWFASMKHHGHTVYLGTYDTEEEAHSAYFEAAKKLQGEFARAG